MIAARVAEECSVEETLVENMVKKYRSHFPIMVLLTTIFPRGAPNATSCCS